VKRIEDAERIRYHLNEMDGGTIAFGFGGNPGEPAAMRGGPVFEFLFCTDTLLRRQSRRDRFKRQAWNWSSSMPCPPEDNSASWSDVLIHILDHTCAWFPPAVRSSRHKPIPHAPLPPLS